MMKVMIFAAGEGKRMRHLSENCPKPLLKVAGKYLIEHQIDRLLSIGIEECVINVSYQAEKIIDALGDGSRYGLRINYSQEESPLETGGGVNKALSLLGEDDFLLVNADLWIEQPALELLVRFADDNRKQAAVIALLVANAAHHPGGDFGLTTDGVVLELEQRHANLRGRYTFSGLSVISAEYFRRYPQRREIFPLKEFLVWAIQNSQMKGVLYDGHWLDVGTPERLAECETLATR